MKATNAAELDFSEYIAERTLHFTGREWLFREIDDWLDDPKAPQFFILTGDPGIGKSAIASRLKQFSVARDRLKSIGTSRKASSAACTSAVLEGEAGLLRRALPGPSAHSLPQDTRNSQSP